MRILPNLFLLLMLSFSLAFEPSTYLYSNESKDDISQGFFSINSDAYTLINISGTPTFLLKNGVLVENEGEIMDAIRQHYVSKYFLTSEELDAIRTQILIYNESRNDGQRFPGYEEDACRGVLLLNIMPCDDDISCQNTSKLFCASPTGQQALGCGDPQDVFDDLRDFAVASAGTTNTINNMLSILNSISPDNAFDQLTQLENYVNDLEDYKNTIEHSPYRSPREGESCSDCYGICPDFEFNQSALNQIKSLISSYKTKIAPINDYYSIASSIYQQTQARLMWKETEKLRREYNESYWPLHTIAEGIKNRTEALLRVISNQTIEEKLDNLNRLEIEIDLMFERGDFSTINESLSEYEERINSLNESISALQSFYESVKDLQREATTYLFIAEGESLSPDAKLDLISLRDKKTQLDQAFKEGLTVAQYEDIAKEYSDLIEEEKALLERKDYSQLVYSFAPLANNFFSTSERIIPESESLSYEQKHTYSSFLPLFFSALFFFSFSSLVVLLNLLYYSTSHRPLGVLSLTLLTMLLIFILLLMAISLYFSMDKSLKDLSFHDYLKLLKDEGSVNIFLDLTEAEKEVREKMKSCAEKLRGVLDEKGITSSIYLLNGESCTQMDSNESVEDCFSGSFPSIIFKAALTEGASYSGLLLKEAMLEGNAFFYETCPIAEALKDYVG